VFQLKLVNYPLKKLYQELEKADRSFRYLLMIQDEIYKRYSLKNDRTSMTIARHERYEFLKNHFEIVNVLVPANHYQGKDFFESRERIFLDEHIEALCGIKNENPLHAYSEIINYYRRILLIHCKFERLLDSMKNKLNSKELNLFIVMEISSKFYDLFKHLTNLIKIMKEMTVSPILIKKFDELDDKLLDLIDLMIDKDVFKKVLLLSKITQKKEFGILLNRAPLNELIAQNQEIEYLKVIK